MPDRLRIAHDPGHRTPIYEESIGGLRNIGYTTGVLSANGFVEADWTLARALAIAAAMPWHDHIMLRDSDEGASYHGRAWAAQARGADLVICHHANASSDPRNQGLMAFVHRGADTSRKIGLTIAAAAPDELYRRRLECYEANPGDWTSRAHYVLQPYHELGLLAVLVEWGHVTDRGDDLAYMMSPESILHMMVCVAAGAARCRGLM